MKISKLLLFAALLFLFMGSGALHADLLMAELDKLAGQPVDIASSATNIERTAKRIRTNRRAGWR